jgi:hypothetical protein
MDVPSAITVAVAFVWLGMVMGISFLEAPLKFRAPGITLQLGLGIGRLVFRALNAAEVVAVSVLLVVVATGPLPVPVVTATGVVGAVLLLQLLAVRPRLTRRSAAVLAGATAPRSRAHHAYVALEVVKIAGLTALGVAALTSLG